MNCTQFQNQLDEFLEGALSGLPATAAENTLLALSLAAPALGLAADNEITM